MALTTQRRSTPDVEDHKKKVEDAAARRKLKAELSISAIKRCLATSDGRVTLKYLMDQCGYQMSSVQASNTTGEHLENNTQYNEGRRDVYLGLRKFAREDVLFDVEIRGTTPEHEILS